MTQFYDKNKLLEFNKPTNIIISPKNYGKIQKLLELKKRTNDPILLTLIKTELNAIYGKGVTK